MINLNTPFIPLFAVSNADQLEVPAGHDTSAREDSMIVDEESVSCGGAC